jgi:hypothetical protein
MRYLEDVEGGEDFVDEEPVPRLEGDFSEVFAEDDGVVCDVGLDEAVLVLASDVGA